MTITLEDLRAEHRTMVVGPELARLIQRIATATAVSYPPSYSDAGVWSSDAIADALQGWTTERLLGRGDLSKLLLGAASVASLRSGLTRSFQQYLTNGRERTSTTNLYQRTTKLLRTDATFTPVGAAAKTHEQLWTMAASPTPEPATMSLRDRVRLAFELSDDDLAVVKYGPFSLKSSPILREPQLKVFVEHLLTGAGALTPGDIIEVMRRRFGLVDPDTIELDEDTEPAEPGIHSQATQDVVIHSVGSRLGADRIRLLVALREHQDFRKAARDCETDESAVRAAYADMLGMVVAESVEPEETEHICGAILESLFVETE